MKAMALVLALSACGGRVDHGGAPDCSRSIVTSLYADPGCVIPLVVSLDEEPPKCATRRIGDQLHTFDVLLYRRLTDPSVFTYQSKCNTATLDTPLTAWSAVIVER